MALVCLAQDLFYLIDFGDHMLECLLEAKDLHIRYDLISEGVLLRVCCLGGRCRGGWWLLHEDADVLQLSTDDYVWGCGLFGRCSS